MLRISLPSNASMDYYPNNTASNFTIKPSKPFEGTGFECAMSEIIFPNRFLNVRENANGIIIYQKAEDGSYNWAARVHVPPGYYATIPELIEAMGKAGLDIYPTKKADGSRNKNIKLFVITYNKTDGKVTVRTRSPWALKFESDIARLLGFAVIHNSEMTRRFSAIIEGEQKGEFHATPSGGLNAMYVYTDIIKEQFVGGESAPLLRIINLNTNLNNGEYISRTFERLYYAPLKSSHFDTINIRIYDDMGELVHFEYGKVVIILEFQKIAI